MPIWRYFLSNGSWQLNLEVAGLGLARARMVRFCSRRRVPSSQISTPTVVADAAASGLGEVPLEDLGRRELLALGLQDLEAQRRRRHGVETLPREVVRGVRRTGTNQTHVVRTIDATPATRSRRSPA